MLIKATLLGVFAASTPLYLFATQNPADQGPGRDAKPTAVSASMGVEPAAAPDELDLLRQRHAAEISRLEGHYAEEVEQLRALHAETLARAETADARAAGLTRQLDECMGFLLAPVPRHNSCRPDRRPISKHYQWMRENGHDKRAEEALAIYVKQVGDKNSNLNSAAWNLMTDKETAGQYDDLALGLANRMEQKGRLDHRQTDTVALAKFLNGYIDEAIELQKKAVQQCNDDDYRRRLRTYEVAKKASQRTAEPVAEPIAEPIAEPAAKPEKKRRKISDDE